MQLVSFEIELADPHRRQQAIEELRSRYSPPLLILDTCQRLECFGQVLPDAAGMTILNTRSTVDAFERLARIAAGLESRILGELEILGQVRTSYRLFREQGGSGHKQLDRLFQDVLSLAREARRESGIDQTLTSLGALASREIMDRIPAAAPVAVVGSGSLAGSVARYLSKRGNHPIRVSSRCPENALELAMQVGGFGAGLDRLSHMLEGVAGIVTATAAPHPVVYEHHLATAQRPLAIVDLGVPADCAPCVTQLADVSYISLIEVEQRAQLNSAERRQRAEVATRIIHEGALEWAQRH